MRITEFLHCYSSLGLIFLIGLFLCLELRYNGKYYQIYIHKRRENYMLTIEEVQAALPSKKKLITQEAVDIINKAQTDPEFQGESLMKVATTYESVLQRNKASIPEYLNAIRFCAYMSTESDNTTEAYKKTFSDRKFVQERRGEPTESIKYRELTAASSRYRRSKLVVEILTLSQVPFDMMFMGDRYKAVGVLANEMVSAKYSKDRITAAKELLAATKNENQKIELEIGPSAEAMSIQSQLDKQLSELAMNQKKMLEAGFLIGEVQKTGVHLEVIEGEVE